MPKLRFYVLEGTISLGSDSVYVRNGEADVPEPFASLLKRRGLAWDMPPPPPPPKPTPPPKPKEEKREEEAEQEKPVTTKKASVAESSVRPKRAKRQRRKKVDKVKKVETNSKDSKMEVKQS